MNRRDREEISLIRKELLILISKLEAADSEKSVPLSNESEEEA
jgi:hypothetical protein